MSVQRTRTLRTTITAIAGVVSLLVTSCGIVPQPAPVRALFTIDPAESISPATKRSSGLNSPKRDAAVLQVRRLRVASPYAGQAFVYRIGSSEFRTDYYNGFIASPDQLVTNSLIAWLSRSGPFESVVDMASGIPAQYVLEGSVTSLYGDYSNKTAPKAVMAISIFLLDDREASLQVIFKKDYGGAASIEPGSVDSLVKGWGAAFRQILEQMTADLDDRSLTGK